MCSLERRFKAANEVTPDFLAAFSPKEGSPGGTFLCALNALPLSVFGPVECGFTTDLVSGPATQLAGRAPISAASDAAHPVIFADPDFGSQGEDRDRWKAVPESCSVLGYIQKWRPGAISYTGPAATYRDNGNERSGRPIRNPKPKSGGAECREKRIQREKVSAGSGRLEVCRTPTGRRKDRL